MHRRSLLLVLPLFSLLLPTARKASAKSPDSPDVEAQQAIEIKPTAKADDTAAAVVDKQLVKPLAQKEAGRNHFSRVYIPPQARRVRMLDRERSTDGRGAEFVAFAVDESSGRYAQADDSRHWRKDAIVGCVYPARDEVFIKRGDKFFGAGLLLGRKTDAADDTVCHAAPTQNHPSPPTLASASALAK